MNWDELRSVIYRRDRGICWVCNTPVNLKDYDLGHLVDRTNGGADEVTNLTVMHRHCNHIKPLHNSLEETLKWKLSLNIVFDDRSLTIDQPKIKQEIIKVIKDNNIKNKQHKKNKYTSKEHLETAISLTIEYFKNRPELLEGKINHERSRHIKLLTNDLQVPIEVIRKALRDGGLVVPQKSIKDGSQYREIVDNFIPLITKYMELPVKDSKVSSRLLGITIYQVDILRYLAGLTNSIGSKNLKSIELRVRKLQIKVPPFNINISNIKA